MTSPDECSATAAALITACNQKSNGDPAISLSQRLAVNALHSLSRRLARAPQTLELRSLDEVEATPERLTTKPHGPFVGELPGEPGRLEGRYARRFVAPPTAVAPSDTSGQASGVADRADALQEVPGR